MEVLEKKLLVSNFKDHVDIPVDFEPLVYLKKNIDVSKAGIDPYEHYITNGKSEGRIYK